MDALPGIARLGIVAAGRTHVHLAAAVDSTVGKRSGVDVLLEVSPERLVDAGCRLYRSPNGVILVREVPPGCIVELNAVTRRARKAEASLRAILFSKDAT